MTTVTRFAPSPTGFLHIGGARTALFNWLYAKHTGGKFLLRIEDTDAERSTPEAVAAIFDSLQWLGLQWDGDVVFQSKRAPRHREVAEAMLAAGTAYRCYCSPEELEQMREQQKAAGLPMRYDGRWSDRDPSEAPAGVKPVIRLKAPRSGETVIHDQVQGDVTIGNEQLDDMVLLRSDGSPTYMLAVVVDDHDMDITHIIRGVDHLNNAARQMQIYQAMAWPVPVFAHIPLIHGPDGAKLSKRHGAVGAEAYRDMGYLPEAMCNYLARLGWGHGDDEIFSAEQAIAWFDLPQVGRSAARMDFDKLRSVNAHYIQASGDDRLLALIEPKLAALAGRPLTDAERTPIRQLMPELKRRAKDLNELADGASFLVRKRPLEVDAKATALLKPEARSLLARLTPALESIEPWQVPALEAAVRTFAGAESRKLGDIAQPVRAALTGRSTSPGVFDVMVALGKPETMARLRDQAR